MDEEIRSKIEGFARDIAAIVRRTALDAVASALGTARVAPARAAAPARKARSAPAPRAKVAAPARKPARAASRAPAGRKAAERAPGAKRPPAELARLVDRLGETIKANPGLRMEALGKALGKPTRELNLPIKKLLAGKRIRSQGHKRATEYFPS